MTDIHRFNSYKILAHADRLRQIADGGMPYPIDWHVYPSNICNHQCVWCMFRQNGEQFDFRVTLPSDVLMRAMDDAARTGARLVHFSGGGEPLINKATPSAMKKAAALGLKVALSTNGRLLTPEIAGLVDYIRVSLNAGTAAQHHATNHGGDPNDRGDWETILVNIAACVPKKKQDLGLGFVVDHQNYQDIVPFCAVAADLDVDFVHIRPAFYYDPEQDAATRAIMPAAFAACARAKAMYGEKVNIFAISDKFDGYWTPRTYHACKAVLTGVCLRATGDFAVCQDRTDLTFGHQPNYKAGASFEDVWHSDEHKRVIACIHDGPGGELRACPRCVWNNRNKIIHEAFIEDRMRLDLV